MRPHGVCACAVCTRLEALVYAHNAGSGRVLEKAGFQLECRERSAHIKQGQYLDGLKYALVRAPPEQDADAAVETQQRDV